MNVSVEIKAFDGDGDLFFRVCRVVKSNGALFSESFFQILHQNITIVLFVYDVCLKGQRILVQGDQFFVFQQIQGFIRQGGHVASDHQG